MKTGMSTVQKPSTAPNGCLNTINQSLPKIFEHRWAPNFKDNHQFSKHDNYNRIQNFGEYYESGYGKKYLKDVHHISNPIFISKDPFSKRTDDSTKRGAVSCPVETYGYRRRYPKRHIPRVLNANDFNNEIYKYNQGPSVHTYIAKKENMAHPSNSLNFESEMFLVRTKKKDLFATESFKHSNNHPWKYSYTKNDYQTCTEPFRRVRSSNVDLSKY